MYKLRIYKLSGVDKGNLDHEEFFDTKNQMDKRYDDLLRKVRKTSMKHLVIFCTENGIYSAVYNFKNIPPTIEDIKEMQKDIQKTESLIQMPAVVNWLPISD